MFCPHVEGFFEMDRHKVDGCVLQKERRWEAWTMVAGNCLGRRVCREPLACPKSPDCACYGWNSPCNRREGALEDPSPWRPARSVRVVHAGGLFPPGAVSDGRKRGPS